MNELVVIGFQGRHRADEVLLEALKSDHPRLQELEDAVVVTRNQQGRLRVKPYCDVLSAATGHKSRLWGEIISCIHASSDKEGLKRIGIDRQTCQQIEQMMPPDSSVIFLLREAVDLEVIRRHVEAAGGHLMFINLVPGSEQDLSVMLRA